MSPKIKSTLADCLGVGGFGVVIFGVYLISVPLACVVGGLGMMAAAILLEKR